MSSSTSILSEDRAEVISDKMEIVILKKSLNEQADEIVALRKTNQDIINLACHWLEKKSENYIHYNSAGQPYYAGTMETDLRAFLTEFVENCNSKAYQEYIARINEQNRLAQEAIQYSRKYTNFSDKCTNKY